jgi:hypothetical protein
MSKILNFGKDGVVQKTRPTPGDAHINAPLTNISVAYVQRSGFVADKAFPVVPVEKQSDVYYLMDRDDFFRDEARVRAPGTESAGGEFALSTASYTTVVEAFHKDIDDQLRANADSVLSLDRAATEFVTQKLLIRRERRWMSSFFTSGVWGTDITPGTLWSAPSSTPGADMETGKMAIQSRTGMKPNKLVLGARVMSALRRNAEIRDQFKYVSAESIDEAMLAGFFGVDQIIVADAVFTTSRTGETGVNPDFLSGKHALLLYAPDTPSLMTPSAGYTFAWSGYTGANAGMRMSKFRIDAIKSDRVEGEIAYSMHRTAADLGYFFNAVVA